MKLVGKVPVEPLDDERLVHVERRIVANAMVTPPARGWLRHVVPLAVSTVAIAVAIAAGWMLRGVPELGGGASGVVATPGGDRVAAPPPIHLAGSATVDIGDATIATAGISDLTIARPDGGVLVTLARGDVELEVAKRHDRPPLVVRAGDTDVVVVGTRFSVAWDGAGPVEVRVDEGVVRCVRGGKEARVTAGESWQSTLGVVAMATTRAAASTATATPMPPTTATPTPSTLELPPDDLGRGHAAAVSDAAGGRTGAGVGRTGAAGALGAGTGIDGGSAGKRVADAAAAKDPQRDLKADIRGQPMMPAMDAGTADAGDAVAKYRGIWSGRFDDDAEHALYSAALVDTLRLGRDDDARTLLELYVRRFATKHDEVTGAAFWLRVRMLCLRAVDDRCRAAASAYVQHGGGPAEHIAEVITTTE